MLNNKTVIGIDLGATNLRGGIVKGRQLLNIKSEPINRDGSMEELMNHLYTFIDGLMTDTVDAIGIGVPGITNAGIVYDLINIPNWKEIQLQNLLKERFNVPVSIDNDANCFALGELWFGKGIGEQSMVGLTIGTGLGCGIIIDGKLYSGANGVAGEFGMVSYLDKNYDYYASGRFFENVYHINGELAQELATSGDDGALKMYEELGLHLANAIQTVMYSTDISLIILGGSVRKAYPYFSKAMWDGIKQFGFSRSLKKLKIEISELENGAILGAAGLAYSMRS